MLNFDSLQSNHFLRAASNDFKVLTDKWVISSAITSAIIAGIGLVFFALFIWKRKNLNPPSYMDLEKANEPDEKRPMTGPGEVSPELPIQPAEKLSSGSQENENPFEDFIPNAQYRGPRAERARGHSRNGSDASSTTANNSAYDSYKETLLKRALLTNSIASTDSTYRDSVSDYGSKTRSRGNSISSISSTYSVDSQYSQTSERIVINNVRMPPQFSTPKPPPFAVSQRCWL